MDLKEKWDTVVWITLAVVGILNEIRKWLKERRKDKPQTDENTALDKQIYPVLHTIKDRYRSMRVFIEQFHDGTRAYSGQSLQRKTITHEVVRDGVTKLKQSVDGILINELTHRILDKLRKDDTYIVSSQEEVMDKERDLYHYMRRHGVKSLFYLRITDRKGETIGTLNIHFPHNNGMYDEQEIYDVKELRRQLEGYFDKIK